MSESDWETHPDVPECLEALPNVQEWSGGPPGCPGVVGKPSEMSESGRETLPDVPEWWEALLDVRQLSGGPWMSGRPSRFFGSHWETIPDVREWSGGPSGCLGAPTG